MYYSEKYLNEINNQDFKSLAIGAGVGAAGGLAFGK